MTANTSTNTLAWLSPTLLLLTASVTAASDGGFQHFISQRGGKLYDGAEEFRFVSWNAPNLHNIEDAFEFLGETPWRWPDEFEIRDALESVRQMGGNVVRTYVISVRRDAGDMGDNVHVLGPNRFNEEAFKALDKVLMIAQEKGVRVIIPLVDNWHWWGGVRQYEAFRGKPEGAFWTDDQLREDYHATVRHVLQRRNTLTGVRYRDDKTILGWETGNELDAPPDWTRATAAYLKQIDPNHLVIDGRSLHGVPVESLNDPNIDVVTTHHYPNCGNNNAQSVVQAIEEVDGRKAYFVGEFGFLPVEEAQRMLDAVIEQGVSGALYWSLRFHRREGGFYWHHEPSGDDLFKAYHWPGFPEGDPYRENQVLPMLHDAAHRIRGIDPAGLASPPIAPRLLPCDSPGLLSWQGSAGASGYDVQRAEDANGPWATVAQNLSDASVQYRPLFCDESASPGVGYFYRIIARNAAGASPASNVIGPVVGDARLLVDEMRDDARLAAQGGSVTPRSGDARRTQEDVHRLALAPGSHVVYQCAAPIKSVQAWLFASDDAQPFDIAASNNGVDFSPLTVRRQTAPKRNSDYGYLRPILVSAAQPRGALHVRLSVPAGDASQEVQLSRVEIRYGGQSDPVR